jgi:hypothetical protein
MAPRPLIPLWLLFRRCTTVALKQAISMCIMALVLQLSLGAEASDFVIE